MPTSPETQRLVQLAADAASAKSAFDLLALDVSEPLPLVDVFLLASGRSERNAQAIADAIEGALNGAGVKTLRREGRAEGRWILLDFGDLVCHVFVEDERMYYALERLWKDCPLVPIEVEAGTAEAGGADFSQSTRLV